MHGEGKNVAPSHGCPNRLMSLMGGYTLQMRNMDSWEGWYWGAKHVWGCEPVGEQNAAGKPLPRHGEAFRHAVFWGCDPEVTPLGFGMHLPTLLSYWFTELGLKSIYICPELNYGAAIHADKWIPVLPNTDAAMQLAIAYQWLKSGDYDKEYIAAHTYGFDKFVDYVLGKEDGEPKTPAWASEKCGVPEWTIKALARHWAKKTVSILHGNGGSYIRGPYSTEPARLEIMLLGMRGLGKPGVHQAKMIEWNMWAKDYPVPFTGEFLPAVPHCGDPLRPVKGDLPDEINMKRFELNPTQKELAPELTQLFEPLPSPKQFIPRCLVNVAITEGKAEWYGMHCCSTSQIPKANNYRLPTNKYQFEKIVYPRPGMSKVHMIWSSAPCNVTCWNHGNLFMDAYRHPDIETFVIQHPWMENDCYFADILLPVCTKHEMNDIGNDLANGVFQSVYLEEPCIEALGESVSDFDACALVAEKLGPEYYDAYTGKLSEKERVRFFYKASGCEERMSCEEFLEKKIYVVPIKEESQNVPAGLYNFYKDPKNNPLTTPTGLLEFSSSDIENTCRMIPSAAGASLGRKERLPRRTPFQRAREEYPLLCMSNHGRWRVHAQCDDVIWTREVETMKIRAKDGYQYEPVWINPKEAETRGIKHGDIVKVFNERGIVLCGAYVTERLIEQVCYVDHGARLDPIIPGWLDRGGCINSISPTSMTSRNSTGMATSGYLVQVEKVTDEEMAGWKRDYPEAFARKVDVAAGVCMDGWTVKE
jgi:trimethylamine-N-oxide reductase (cytochrome c)